MNVDGLRQIMQFGFDLNINHLAVPQTITDYSMSELRRDPTREVRKRILANQIIYYTTKGRKSLADLNQLFTPDVVAEIVKAREFYEQMFQEGKYHIQLIPTKVHKDTGQEFTVDSSGKFIILRSNLGINSEIASWNQIIKRSTLLARLHNYNNITEEERTTLQLRINLLGHEPQKTEYDQGVYVTILHDLNQDETESSLYREALRQHRQIDLKSYKTMRTEQRVAAYHRSQDWRNAGFENNSKLAWFDVLINNKFLKEELGPVILQLIHEWTGHLYYIEQLKSILDDPQTPLDLKLQIGEATKQVFEYFEKLTIDRELEINKSEVKEQKMSIYLFGRKTISSLAEWL
jgi:hypothetical protein